MSIQNHLETRINRLRHNFGINLEVAKCVANDWLDNFFQLPQVTHWTDQEWLEANLAVEKNRRDVFGNTVKTDELVSKAFGVLGTVLRPFTYPSEKLATNRTLATMAMAGVAGLTFFGQVEHALAMDHNHRVGVSNLDLSHSPEISGLENTPTVVSAPIVNNENSNLLYIPPQTNRDNRVIVGEKSTKFNSYFIVEGDIPVTELSNAGLEPLYGINEVDRILVQPYDILGLAKEKYPDQNPIIEYAAGQLNVGGIKILSSNMMALIYEDTKLAPVNSIEVGRRGGFNVEVVDKAIVILGVTEDGQAIAVFHADEDGNLSGLTTGDEGLGVLPLVWGHHGSEFERVLGINLNGEYIPISSADMKEVYYPTSDGSLRKGSAKNAVLVPENLSSYVSPDYKKLVKEVSDISVGKYEIEDGGQIWNTETQDFVPGVQIDKNGTIAITVNNEVIEQADVSISTDSKGNLVIGAYTQTEDGGWVMALPDYLKLNKDGSYNLTLSTGEIVKLGANEVSLSGGNVTVLAEGYYMTPDGWRMTAEKMWSNEASEWGLTIDKYTERHDVDGNLAIVDDSGTVVYWVDSGGVGYWNLQVMRKMIVETEVKGKSCYPTQWVGTVGKSIPPKVNTESYNRNFARPFFDKVKAKAIELGIMKDYPIGIPEFLGGANNCWVDIHLGHIVQNPEDLETNYIFWLNGDKEIQHEQAFSPKVKKIELAK